MTTTYISTVPFSRNNELWLDGSILCNNSNITAHSLITGRANAADTRHFSSFYEKIALDIVAETVYNYRYPYISEKTLRPIACKRLFIIVGAPGTLALLRSKGFHTFPDIIDEGYDSILDPIKRWCYLENTIKDFVLKPIDEIKEIVKNKSSILEENFLTLVNLQSQEIKNINV
jgi:hypothetical protein